MKLPKKYRSAFIIDGQHRIYGYSDIQEKTHRIPVVAFYNLEHYEQTRIFHDINSNQKKPPANLLESIKAELNWGSDDKGIAISALKTRLLVELNNDEKSPFYNRIVVSEEKKEGLKCLTLKTIKDQGLGTASNYFGRFKSGKQIEIGYLTRENIDKTYQTAYCFFNNLFTYIASNYPEQWSLGNEEGGLLAMNVGVVTLLKICDQLIDFETKFNRLKPNRLSGEKLAEKLYNYLDIIIAQFKKKPLEELKELRRKSRGSGGPKNLLPYFQEAIHNEIPEFEPEGLVEWID